MTATFEQLTLSAETFWSKVERKAEGECWPWMGWCYSPRPRRLAYGMFRPVKTAAVRAHRAAWMLAHGSDVPAGKVVCHGCDNPKCCNPAHLWIGTPGDNNRDRSAKGRTVRPERDESAVNYATGSRHGSAKLTPDDVTAILTDPRTHTAVAAEYGVAITTIGRIRSGKRWKSLRALTHQPGDEG